jgi:hypothetical protein
MRLSVLKTRIFQTSDSESKGYAGPTRAVASAIFKSRASLMIRFCTRVGGKIVFFTSGNTADGFTDRFLRAPIRPEERRVLG